MILAFYARVQVMLKNGLIDLKEIFNFWIKKFKILIHVSVKQHRIYENCGLLVMVRVILYHSACSYQVPSIKKEMVEVEEQLCA